MYKYRAFISYSHRDKAIAKKLHRCLEQYRPPKHQTNARRIAPVFRDREELAVDYDLPSRLTEALHSSENLIVLCSPDAAKSSYVAKEITTFASSHDSKRIFPVIVGGSVTTCFPKALLAVTPEPLAANLTKSGDGFAEGTLKLIAGLLPAPYGSVKDRETERARQRSRVNGGLAAIFALLLIVAVLAGWRAVEETRRANIELSRAEAAVLTALEGIADIVDHFHKSVDSGAMPVGLASRSLKIAENIAQEIYNIAPVNPKLINIYSKLLLSISHNEYRSGNYEVSIEYAEKAIENFDHYTGVTDLSPFLRSAALLALVDAERAKPEFDLRKLVNYLEKSLNIMKEEASKRPITQFETRAIQIASYRLADLYKYDGNLGSAKELYIESIQISLNLFQYKQELHDLRGFTIGLYRLGSLLTDLEEYEEAESMFNVSLATARATSLDHPNNMEISRDLSVILYNIAEMKIKQGKTTEANNLLDESLGIANKLHSIDPLNSLIGDDIQFIESLISNK